MEKICFYFKTFSFMILMVCLPFGLTFASGSFEVQAQSESGFQFQNPYNNSVSVTFKATGEWTCNVNASSGNYRTANGSVGESCGYCILKNAPIMSLIVHRGNGGYEFMGSARTLLLEPKENVRFLMNEAVSCRTNTGLDVSCYGDNKGSLSVTWTLEK